MATAGIPIVDLYAAITGKCGAVPQARRPPRTIAVHPTAVVLTTRAERG